MNPGEKSRLAGELFRSGANCAQAVLAAFAPECGLERAAAYRLASGFGGGVSRLREVCGAVSGMVLAADLLRGPADPADKAAKDAHYALIQSLAERFRAENGSIVCRELLKLGRGENSAPVSEARTAAYYRKRPCAELVEMAAKILAETLNREDDGRA